MPPHCPQTWDCAEAKAGRRATRAVKAAADFIVVELVGMLDPEDHGAFHPDIYTSLQFAKVML